jgi:hypothetical protein
MLLLTQQLCKTRSSQDSVSEDHSRGTVISRQNSTIQANAEFSDVSLGTSPDIVIEM